VLTRARRMLGPAASPVAPAHRVIGAMRVTVQTAGMFALTLIGWLLFRETELPAIVRDLQLSPLAASAQDRMTGLYLFLLAFTYSVPLWIQSLWVEVHRDASGVRRPAPILPAGWPRVAVQGVGCGAAFAAILILRSRTSLDFIYFQF